MFKHSFANTKIGYSYRIFPGVIAERKYYNKRWRMTRVLALFTVQKGKTGLWSKKLEGI